RCAHARPRRCRRTSSGASEAKSVRNLMEFIRSAQLNESRPNGSSLQKIRRPIPPWRSGQKKAGPESVFCRLNVRLHTPIVFDLALSHDRLRRVDENLWYCPLPVLHMAVGERKTAPLVVAIGRQIPPFIRHPGAGPGNAEKRIDNLIFMHVQKNE